MVLLWLLLGLTCGCIFRVRVLQVCRCPPLFSLWKRPNRTEHTLWESAIGECTLTAPLLCLSKITSTFLCIWSQPNDARIVERKNPDTHMNKFLPHPYLYEWLIGPVPPHPTHLKLQPHMKLDPARSITSGNHTPHIMANINTGDHNTACYNHFKVAICKVSPS